MKLDSIIVGDRVRKDMGDLGSLAASMKVHGLLHPVVVKKDRTLVAGHRRLEAARRLGWQDIPVTVVDVEDLLTAERDENQERKDFTPTEAVAIGRLIEERHRAKIAAKKHDACVRGGMARQGKAPAGSNEPPAGRSEDVASKAVGLSRMIYYRAKAVVGAAEADPEVFGDLPAQMDETRKIGGVHTEMLRRKGNHKGKKVSLSKTGKNVERIQEQQLRAGLWLQVKEALIALSSLPDAAEVVAIVRAHARDKTLVDKKLAPALKWLKEFSDGWSKGNGKN